MNNTARTLHEQDDCRREELIGGKVFLMSPRPVLNHHRVAENIARIFEDYLEGKPCEAFGDGVDLYLTEDDHFIPDGMVVCDPDKLRANHICGAPDLVVEILSPSTANNDKIRKRKVYERCGVREYWVVSIESRSVEVYLLRDGVLELDHIYTLYPAVLAESLDEQEKASLLVEEFRCSLFPELSIPLNRIFSRLLTL